MLLVLRRIHLFAGLALLVFVVMYFATGYVMIHGKWFPRGQPTKTTHTEKLDYAGDPATEEFTRHLEDAFSIHGKRQPPKRQNDGSWKFNWIRPGMNFEAIVAPNGGQVTITRTQFDAVVTAIGLHRLHGYGGGGLYVVWAVVYDLASAAMILFALTGIYLWYQTATRRWFGWLCLAVSLCFSGAMILYLMR